MLEPDYHEVAACNRSRKIMLDGSKGVASRCDSIANSLKNKKQLLPKNKKELLVTVEPIKKDALMLRFVFFFCCKTVNTIFTSFIFSFNPMLLIS